MLTHYQKENNFLPFIAAPTFAPMLFAHAANFMPQMGAGVETAQQSASSNLQEVDHVRSVFPETWLWSNTTLRY